ncbi:sugar-binding transcriptional regulator [Loigolactobacillus zhaoyuanensis]|uniref:sugar-binding transcriptional regulator n=1 Tax=Loigolactobacillus zhaoyuanensis TaxID=2486017 RepID=UPI000F73E2FC|nr:sugar-binding domain-containing protein [Loigolactobacillus zhaoyuanensis]
MDQEFAWLKVLAPDLLEVVKQRYQVLQSIYWLAPIGRRLLAQELNLSERALRTETDFLRLHGLITASKSGMILTAQGEEAYQGLTTIMDRLLGVRSKEKQLSQVLGIDHCLIVAGDSANLPKVLSDMGKLVNETLDIILPRGENVIAVMGGTTMAEVADSLTSKLAEQRHLIFVPARGGLGEAVNIQANAVCARMAAHTGGEHRVLYIPEHVSEQTYKPLLAEPAVKEVLQLVDKSSAVVHSIGGAIPMAKRRNMSAETIAMLQQKQAVGEAFGYFFNQMGEVIYKIPRIGLQLHDLERIASVIAVAGGSDKAAAIKAYAQLAPQQTWLITDEGAANLILKGVTL